MRPPDSKPPDPPVVDGRASEDRPAARQSPVRPGVLVVDDEHLVRIMVQLGLERNGFDVWLAASGREAIHVYRKHRDRIGVVLLDVRMPGLDGPATLDVLHGINPDLLVCFMSGDPGAYSSEELRQRGAVHFIAKPFVVNELVNAIRLLTRGAAAAEPASGGTCPQ